MANAVEIVIIAVLTLVSQRVLPCAPLRVPAVCHTTRHCATLRSENEKGVSDTCCHSKGVVWAAPLFANPSECVPL